MEFEVENIPSQVRKEVTCEAILSAGDVLKAEVGAEEDLNEVVPEGKQWDVVLNIRLVETDV